ncbi:MAG: hypothetical protein ABIQ55_07135 [Gemmatimonadaceae bacterium]
MYNEDQDLSEPERAALAALPREISPGDLLEERVVRALRSEGHFGSERGVRRSWMTASVRIAAAAALFIGGVATGRYMLAQPSERAATANVTSPANDLPAAPVDQITHSKPVKNSETVVAEREMWL